MTTEETTAQKLAAAFDVGELKFFPVALTRDKKKARVGSYIDARAVMDRLDSVVGVGNWRTSYKVVDTATKAVECTLEVAIDDHWVSKADVGYPNEARDADNPDKEPYKAAYSDAIKRAAVQFGVGRYIYSLELVQEWLPVDEFGKFTEQPRLKGTPAPRPAAPQPAPAQPAASLSEALHSSVEAIKAKAEGSTFPGSLMVNGDGTLNFTEFWSQCRKHGIDNTTVAKEVGGDLNNLKRMTASACVDVFNLLRERQKQPA